MNLITRHFESTPIVFNDDGWINATQTAKAFEKDIRDFVNTKQYKEYLKALAIYQKADEGKYRIGFKGGNDRTKQGTFLHPDLLILFARWLSPDFAVWCDMEIVKGYFERVISKQQTVIDELVKDRDKNKWWMND